MSTNHLLTRKYQPFKVVSRDAKRSDDVEFLIGFETEVIFLKSTDPIIPVNDYGWSESTAILAGSNEAKALEEIANALDVAGIELQMYHAEAAPGQVKITSSSGTTCFLMRPFSTKS